MNPQEKELLARCLEQLTAARAGQKDPEADALIREAVARQPEAAYLLVQRALQLDQAFQATQAQVTKLQNELDQSRGSAGTSGGFLGDPYAWGSRPAAPAAQNAAPQQSAAARMQAPAAPAAPVTRPSPWGSNLLGTAAMTAAGVVAGSFLYQGIQGLMNRNEPSAADRPHTTSPLEDSPHTAGPLEQDEPQQDWLADSGGDVDGGDLA